MCKNNCGKCASCCKKLAIGNASKLGLDGINGATWHTGNGAPSNGLGVINDLYLNIANGDVYKKTGSAVWAVQGNIAGPAGAAGANGTNGTNGTNARTTLFNNLAQTNSGNTGGAYTLKATNNIPANTLVTDGDSIAIDVVMQADSTFVVDPDLPFHARAGIQIDSNILPIVTWGSGGARFVYAYTIKIDRISANSYLISTLIFGTGFITDSQIITGADFTAAIAVKWYVITNTSNIGWINLRKSFAEYKPK